MASSVTCPSCGRALSLPEDFAGMKVQCPTCGTAFDAAPVAPLTLDEDTPLQPSLRNVPPPPRPLVAVLVDSRRDSPSETEEEDFERCPMCKRKVPVDHDICPACGTDLASRPDADGRLRGPLRRDYEPHRAGLISVLGALSILFGVAAALALCAPPFAVAGLIGAGLGGAGLLLAREDLELMDRNIMDPEGRRRTVAGQTNAMIGTIVSVLGILVGALHALVYFGRLI